MRWQNCSATRCFYVDTFEPEEEIDVAAVQKDILRIEAELAEVRTKMAEYLKELGVDA